MDIRETKRVAIVMAGGANPKFWPRSTEKKPKPFQYYIGEGTMIQNTISRILPIFKPEDIFIVLKETHLNLAMEQLPFIPKENFILEPFPRNTAICIALSATIVQQYYSQDSVMTILPSDHYITNLVEFQNSLNLASELASVKKGIVTIGLTPIRPETTFGYIQIEEKSEGIEEFYTQGARYSRTFAEKPDEDTAKRFIQSGDFFWNSGIFSIRIDNFWLSFKEFLPDHYRLFILLKSHLGKLSYKGILEYIYMQMKAESIDYAILEKADNVFVVLSSFGWSDLSSWDELFRLSVKDARNNYIEGDVIALNVSNSIISAWHKPIAISGVDSLVVIDSEDAILICKRNKGSEVKELVDYMKRKRIGYL
ncbi:MAG: mannose-1-phosphate guanylyltransferase [Ignavibacteria bacterium]|nr:mannose-1-phosphate guanylyltransferase [Ignavibacteria bacterium]